MQNCPPPTFLTHNNAIAGFTSQSLGLAAYACKTDSSTAIKLAPRMHQNLPFCAQKSKKISPGGEGTPPPHIPPPRRFVPRARHDSSPSHFKQWICPWPIRKQPMEKFSYFSKMLQNQDKSYLDFVTFSKNSTPIVLKSSHQSTARTVPKSIGHFLRTCCLELQQKECPHTHGGQHLEEVFQSCRTLKSLHTSALAFREREPTRYIL